MNVMKNYQTLIGLVIIAIAVLIAGIYISSAIESGFSSVHSALGYMGTLIRDGLLQEV